MLRHSRCACTAMLKTSEGGLLEHQRQWRGANKWAGRSPARESQAAQSRQARREEAHSRAQAQPGEGKQTCWRASSCHISSPAMPEP